MRMPKLRLGSGRGGGGWLGAIIPPLTLLGGATVGIYYGFVMRKPTTIADVVVTPYPVRPNSSFMIAGQFKDKDGNGAFVPQGRYYVYHKIPPTKPGEVETRVLQASGSLGTLQNGIFQKLISSEGFPDGRYALVVNDGTEGDIPHMIFSLFNPGAADEEEPASGTATTPPAPPLTVPVPPIPIDPNQLEDIDASIPIPWATGPGANPLAATPISHANSPFSALAKTRKRKTRNRIDREWDALTSEQG